MAIDINWTMNDVLDSTLSQVVLELIPIKMPVEHLLDCHGVHNCIHVEMSQRSNIGSRVRVWSDEHIGFLKLLDIEVRNVISIAFLEMSIDNKHFVLVDLASVI